VGPLDGGAEHRMRLSGVRAGDEDESAACSTSRIEPDAAEVLSARCIAATDVEWHNRVQWSIVGASAREHPHHE